MKEVGEAILLRGRTEARPEDEWLARRRSLIAWQFPNECKQLAEKSICRPNFERARLQRLLKKEAPG